MNTEYLDLENEIIRKIESQPLTPEFLQEVEIHEKNAEEPETYSCVIHDEQKELTDEELNYFEHNPTPLDGSYGITLYAGPFKTAAMAHLSLCLEKIKNNRNIVHLGIADCSKDGSLLMGM